MTIQKKSFLMIAALFVAGSSLKAHSSALIATAHAASAAAHSANIAAMAEATSAATNAADDAVRQTRDLVTGVELAFETPSVSAAQLLVKQSARVLDSSVTPLISMSGLEELLPMEKCVNELVTVDAPRAIAQAPSAHKAMCIAAKTAKAVHLLAIACGHEGKEALAVTSAAEQANASAVQAAKEAIGCIHKSVMEAAVPMRRPILPS